MALETISMVLTCDGKILANKSDLEIKHLLEGHVAPKRPNRVSPIHSEESALQAELDAWEAASDEAFELH